MSDAMAGSAELSLASNVIPLDPETTVFKAMLEGWADQQRARLCKPQTIQARATTVRRFAEFAGTYPWQWRADDADAYFARLMSGESAKADSTLRGYQNALRLFCEFVTDHRYGWKPLCLKHFNEVPQQILHEWNTAAHVTDFEGRPGRRPLSYDEVQELFDSADGLADEARRRHRKGGLSALRDSAFLKTVYAYGLRRQEAVGLDLVDFRSNPKLSSYRPRFFTGVRLGV